MKKTLIVLCTVLLAFLLYGCVGCNTISFDQQRRHVVPPLPEFKRKELALVLGDGGAKGFIHLGVLEELHNSGIKPDVIIGCSSGSIVGALYAANPNIEQLKALMLRSKKTDIIRNSTVDWPYSLFSKKAFKQYLSKHIKQQKIEDLQIPLIVTATNLRDGNLEAFGMGDLIPRVMASAALPGAFAPEVIDGEYYIDCAAANPVPVAVAKRLGFKRVIAVNVAERLPESAPSHAAGVMKRGMEIAYMQHSNLAAAQADVVLSFELRDIGMFSEQHNATLYATGKKVARDAMDKIKALYGVPLS